MNLDLQFVIQNKQTQKPCAAKAFLTASAVLSFIFKSVGYVSDLLMHFVIRVPPKPSRMKLVLQA